MESIKEKNKPINIIDLFLEQYKKEHEMDFTQYNIDEIWILIKFFTDRCGYSKLLKLFSDHQIGTHEIILMLNCANILLKHEGDSEKNLLVQGFNKYVRSLKQAMAFSKVIVEFDRLAKSEAFLQSKSKTDCSLQEYDALCRAACTAFVSDDKGNLVFSFSDLMYDGTIIKTTEEAIKSANKFIMIVDKDKSQEYFSEQTKTAPKTILSKQETQENKDNNKPRDIKHKEKTRLLQGVLIKRKANSRKISGKCHSI